MKNSIHVLVVDDNHINRQYFSMALKKLGINIQLAESGQQAIQLATGSRFDLILMDIRMPNMDGCHAASQIRLLPNHINTPIIAISAENSSEAQNDVFNGFILKPVSPAQLKQNIETYCQLDNQTVIVFDQEKALKFAYNDKDIMHKIIELFITDIPVQMNLLSISLTNGNFHESIAIIHKLLGSCQACGALEIEKNLKSLSSNIKVHSLKNQTSMIDCSLNDLINSIESYKSHVSENR